MKPTNQAIIIIPFTEHGSSPGAAAVRTASRVARWQADQAGAFTILQFTESQIECSENPSERRYAHTYTIVGQYTDPNFIAITERSEAEIIMQADRLPPVASVRATLAERGMLVN